MLSGAGVGGLMLAVILSQHPNIQVDVYEAAHELREVGAGIGMWPRTWKIMKKLGLADALARKSIIPAEGIPSTTITSSLVVHLLTSLPSRDTEVAFKFRKGDEPAGGRTFQTLTTPGKRTRSHSFPASRQPARARRSHQLPSPGLPGRPARPTRRDECAHAHRQACRLVRCVR